MIHAKNGIQVLQNLQSVISPGSGIEHWGASYFGPRYSTNNLASGPQALITEMSANETILPHFHGVTQFQIFPSGVGMMAKLPVQPLMLQYKDHHSAYGPLVAGAHGLTFIALRKNTGDSAPVYLNKPGYKDKLLPSKRRNWLSPHIELSTKPVLQFRKKASFDPLFDVEKITDELAAHICRLGANMSMAGPDPRLADGYYVFVANGSMEHNGELLNDWSLVFVEPTESSFQIKAGPDGLEALVMQFPREETVQ